MPKFLKKVQFLHSNIGYFPPLQKYLAHGFSWDKGAGNMQFSLGDPVEVRASVLEFLDKLDMGGIRDSVHMIPEHGDRIMDIDKDEYTSLKQHRFGRSVRCDAVFTKLPNVTLTVKPADCTTAIVFCKKQNIVGLIHSGRRGVEAFFPQKSINHLIDHYGCEVCDICIGIVPHLFKENRQFENIDDLDKEVWKGFVEKKGGYFYPAETELAIKQYQDSGILDKNFFVYDVDTFAAASKGKTFSFKYHLEMKRQGKKVPEGRFMVAVRRK
jgi:copper oxidase (laccase) domain-containing protein